MDVSVVSDLLVSPQDAIKVLQGLVETLAECTDNEFELLKWYRSAIDEINAIFASQGGSYFEENSGMDFEFDFEGEMYLTSKNVKRTRAILLRMKDGVAETITGSNLTGKATQDSSVDKLKDFLTNRKIFVVHGHDETTKSLVVSVLSKLDFEPVILNEKANQGMTILEKIEAHGKVGFAVVAFTADDKGASNRDFSDGKFDERPRQNVLLELGYFWGQLGRKRVCLLNSIDNELSSDLRGLGYTPLDYAGHWKFELVKELKAAGYAVDANKLLE